MESFYIDCRGSLRRKRKSELTKPLRDYVSLKIKSTGNVKIGTCPDVLLILRFFFQIQYLCKTGLSSKHHSCYAL